MVWLALDQGTSATKAVVIDDSGSEIAVAEAPVDVHAGPDGAVESAPELLWASLVAAGTSALASAGNPTLDAIALANQGETVLAWDPATTRPLTPAVSWQDRRAAAICAARRDDADELRSITGLELDPYFVAPKLRWIRDECTRDGMIGTTDSWLLHRLTGSIVTDVATASRSLLLDLDARQWSPRCIDIFGLGAESFATIIANDATVGVTNAFGTPTIVRGVCVDQQAALYGEACHDRGSTKCTYGTGAFVLANAGESPIWSRSGLVGCVAWDTQATGPTYCLDGQVYTAGAAISWLETIGLIAEPEDLDRLAATVPGPTDVVFVPGLAGLAAPFWRPEARGAFTGLSLATTREHLVYSALEGIAAQIAWLVRGIGDDLGGPVTRLRVDGGLTGSQVLLQLQADLAQVPVDVYPSPHATAFGVAQLGGAPAPVWSARTSVEPQITRDAADSRLLTWRRTAEAVLRA
jgi:glycerol kinase